MDLLFSPAASQQLTHMWRAKGRLCLQHSEKDSLWHCGILSVTNFDAYRPLWTTRISINKSFYSGIAKADAARGGVNTYLTEFVPLNALFLADFKNTELLRFCNSHCSSDHSLMTSILSNWVIENGLHGIVNLNGREGEVVIAQPYASVRVLQQTRI